MKAVGAFMDLGNNDQVTKGLVMRVLAIANQKGGVGKSTLTVHLAYAGVDAGLRVLLVDLDRQGSLSLSFPAADGEPPGAPASALFSTEPGPLVAQRLGERLAIFRADDTLSLLGTIDSDALRRPARQLQSLSSRFDLCLLDTPGSIGFNPPMTVAALIAADAVVCPVAVGLYEAQGLGDLWAYLKQVKSQAYNPRLRLMGLLPSKVNTRSREECAALDKLRGAFGPVMLPGMLAERSAVKQAIALRRPVWKNTRGAGHLAAAREWRAMCAHVLGQLGEVAK